MGRVVIGMDPHKRSPTIEIIDERERVLTQGRYATDTDGYQAMLAAGRQFSSRVWAVEGCAGIGRHIAQRLVADGETVLDVPAKLAVRVRVFDTGQGRKTDPVDAHSVAVAGLRSPNLRTVAADDATVALRLLAASRRDRPTGRGSTTSRPPRANYTTVVRDLAYSQVRPGTAIIGVRERIIGELATVDGGWRVQVIDGHRRHWYRLVGPHCHHDGLSLAAVHRLLREAGIDLAELTPAPDAA